MSRNLTNGNKKSFPFKTIIPGAVLVTIHWYILLHIPEIILFLSKNYGNYGVVFILACVASGAIFIGMTTHLHIRLAELLYNKVKSTGSLVSDATKHGLKTFILLVWKPTESFKPELSEHERLVQAKREILKIFPHNINGYQSTTIIKNNGSWYKVHNININTYVTLKGLKNVCKKLKCSRQTLYNNNNVYKHWKVSKCDDNTNYSNRKEIILWK